MRQDNPKVKSGFSQEVELISRTKLSVSEARDLVNYLISMLAEVDDISDIIEKAKTLYREGGNQ